MSKPHTQLGLGYETSEIAPPLLDFLQEVIHKDVESPIYSLSEPLVTLITPNFLEFTKISSPDGLMVRGYARTRRPLYEPAVI